MLPLQGLPTVPPAPETVPRWPADLGYQGDPCPALSPDGTRLYFSSDRRPSQKPELPWKATVRETLRTADYDIYSCEVDWELLIGSRIDGEPLEPPPPGESPWTKALSRLSALSNLNESEWAEGSLAVSPAGDFLYFASSDAGLLHRSPDDVGRQIVGTDFRKSSAPPSDGSSNCAHDDYVVHGSPRANCPA